MSTRSLTISHQLSCGVLLAALVAAILGWIWFSGHRDDAEHGQLTGYWRQISDRTQPHLPTLLHIATNDSGVLEGKLSDPEGEDDGVSVSFLVVRYPKLKFEVPDLGAKFNGSISSDGQNLLGHWESDGGDSVVTWERTTNPFKSGAEKIQYSCVEEEAQVTNGALVLFGTIARPVKWDQRQAVLLIGGSGPLDRDETIDGHPVFRTMAKYLVGHGFAVLRLDKRGVGESGGDFRSADLHDFADDARAALTFLHHYQGKNVRVGIIGHSEGAIVAEMVAARCPESVGWVALLAGPGIDGDAFAVQQAVRQAKSSGASPGQIKAINRYMSSMVEVLKSTTNNEVAKATIWKNYRRILEPLLDNSQQANYLVGLQIDNYISRWTRSFVAARPADYLKEIKCPVLALNGDRDEQVSCEENLEAIGAVLRASGNTHFELQRVSGVNHLFQSCSNGAMSEYAKIDQDIAPTVLASITRWIIDQTNGAATMPINESP